MQMDSLKIGRGFKVLPTEFADLSAATQNAASTVETSNKSDTFCHGIEVHFSLQLVTG